MKSINFIFYLIIIKLCYGDNNKNVTNQEPNAIKTTTENSQINHENVGKKLTEHSFEFLNKLGDILYNEEHELQELKETTKEKRCQPEFVSSVNKLILQRRDLTREQARKNCEVCRESILCKKHGRCETCDKLCEKADAGEIVSLANRMNDDNTGLSSKDSRFYTLGAFGPGSIQDLILRLVDTRNIENISRLIVLAETNSQHLQSINPLIIDTANVLVTNNGKAVPIEIQIHPVNNNGKNKDEEEIISGVNVELDSALEAKKKFGNNPQLTPDEIDAAINRAVANTGILSEDSPLVGSENSQIKPTEEKREEKDQNVMDETVACSDESEEYRSADDNKEVADEKEQSNYVTNFPPPLSRPEADSQQLQKETVGDSNKNAAKYLSKFRELSSKSYPRHGDAPEEFPKDIVHIKDEQRELPTTATKRHPLVTGKDLGKPQTNNDQIVGANQLPTNDDKKKLSYEDKYEKLKKFLTENAALLPKEQQSNMEKIINESTDKNLDVPQQNDNNNKDVLVKLENMEPFRTKINQNQMDEIEKGQNEETTKLNDEEKVALIPHPYQKHPKLLPTYTNKLLYPKKTIPSTKLYRSGILGNAPSEPMAKAEVGNSPSLVEAMPDEAGNINEKPPAFIDPKLLDVNAVIDDLKRVPSFVLDNTRKLAETFKPNTPPTGANQILQKEKPESLSDLEIPTNSDVRPNSDVRSNSEITTNSAISSNSDIRPKSEIVAKQENVEKNAEDVACSKEEDEEYRPVIITPPGFGNSGYSKQYGSSHDEDEYERAIHEMANKRKYPGLVQKQDPSKGLQDNPNVLEAKTLEANKQEPTKLNLNNFNDEPVENRMAEEGIDRNVSPRFNSQILGAKMDWAPNEQSFDNSQVQKSHYVGKFVPDISSSVVDSKQDLQHQENKMYFVGNDVKLPVHMKQHNDGSYHVSVDVDKLCNCKENNCTGGGEVVGSNNNGDGNSNNENVIGNNNNGDVTRNSNNGDVIRSSYNGDVIGSSNNGRVINTNPEEPQIQQNQKQNLMGSDIQKRSPQFNVAYNSKSIIPEELMAKYPNIFKKYKRNNDVSNEEDDIKYKFENNVKSKTDDVDVVPKQIDLVKNMLYWMKNLISDDAKIAK